MNPYSFSALVFAICSFLIGIQIIVRRRDRSGVIYFFLSLLYCVWGIGYSLCTAGNLNYVPSLQLIRISNLAAAFIPVVWLHFCLIYTGRMRGNNYLYLLMYIWPVIVGFGLFTQQFIPGLKPIAEFKYYPIPGFLYNIHTSIFFVIMPIGFYQLLQSIKSLSGEERKHQICFLVVSFLGYLGGGLSFFPVYDIAVPQYGLFLLPLYPFGKAYFMGSSGLLFDEERMAQAAHKDKLASLGILTASINHEIRGPLFAMRGAVEMEAGNDQLKNKLLSEIDRLTGIVSRLTHFAKKGVDEAAKIEPIDLKEVISDVRPLLQHQFNYQNVQYDQEIAPNLPFVLADRRYLEEILFNLLINACQAVRNIPNPKIKLSVNVSRSTNYDPRTTNHAIVITIADNGSGIPANQIKEIFKPFHTTKSEGTGLGLYITKQLVEKCRGTLGVESSAAGAKFVFILSIWTDKVSPK